MTWKIKPEINFYGAETSCQCSPLTVYGYSVSLVGPHGNIMGVAQRCDYCRGLIEVYILVPYGARMSFASIEEL